MRVLCRDIEGPPPFNPRKRFGRRHFGFRSLNTQGLFTTFACHGSQRDLRCHTWDRTGTPTRTPFPPLPRILPFFTVTDRETLPHIITDPYKSHRGPTIVVFSYRTHLIDYDGLGCSGGPGVPAEDGESGSVERPVSEGTDLFLPTGTRS